MSKPQRPIRLLLVCPYFFEPHRWMISAYKTALFLSKSIPVTVLTTGKTRYEKLNENLTIYRMKDWFIPDPVNYSIVPGLFPSLIRVIRKEKPTHYLVNKHMFFTSLSIILLRLMGKKVITATDTFPGINWHPNSRFVRIVMKIYAICIGMPLLKLSSKVVLYHEGLVEVAKKYHLRYTVIPNGVDLEKIESAVPNHEFSKNGLTTVLYAGRLESIKGYLDIIEVAKEITSSNESVQFVLVGSCHGKEEQVKEWQSERIIFTNHRDDVISLMKSADIFLLASYSEGLPNALMEAMACGLACVSSRVGGVTTLIKSEDEGLLFKAGDRKEMREKLEALIGNSKLRKSLGSNAKRAIEQRHSWAHIAKEYQALFESL